MYTHMSPETAEFIEFLLDNGLYDVEIRGGKWGGGYMTFFEKCRAPFIFANFDGTSENAYIMCHEGGRAEDYRTMHLEGAVRLIISECLQNEFQELVYDRSDMMPEERNALWAQLERAYWPTRDCGDDEFELAGCGWQRIPHVFQWPFYAIDYALAQVCALEYLRWMNEDHEAAWNSYLDFCRRTGTDSFPGLVRSAGLGDPFGEETLPALAEWLSDRLL